MQEMMTVFIQTSTLGLVTALIQLYCLTENLDKERKFELVEPGNGLGC